MALRKLKILLEVFILETHQNKDFKYTHKTELDEHLAIKKILRSKASL